MKIKTLNEEICRPQNVHKWRTIEAVVPEQFDLIQKHTELQRRISKRDQEIEKRETIIEEKNKAIEKLKTTLERMPSPDIAQQSIQLKSALADKTTQVQALESEVAMYRSLIH